jgi:hypothetical protein
MNSPTQCPHCHATIAPNVDKHTCPKRRDLKRERERAQRLFGIGPERGRP